MTKPKGKQGFASMDPIKLKEITSKGGRTAHLLKRAHEWNSKEARAAGKVGGSKSKAKKA